MSETVESSEDRSSSWLTSIDEIGAQTEPVAGVKGPYSVAGENLLTEEFYYAAEEDGEAVSLQLPTNCKMQENDRVVPLLSESMMSDASSHTLELHSPTKHSPTWATVGHSQDIVQ